MNDEDEKYSVCRFYLYKWTIDKSSFCKKPRNGYLRSLPFTDVVKVSEVEWAIDLYPKGYQSVPPNGNDLMKNGEISLFLTLYDNGNKEKEFLANFRLGIIDVNDIYVTFIESKKLFKENVSWGKIKFITEDILFDQNYELISNDKFTIFCEVSALLPDEDETPEPPIEPKNFELLLQNKGISDVTIVVNGKEFQAHKTILAAHSPVFQSKMNESTTNQIEINDIDEKVMEELMKYMYTGEINNLKETVHNLVGVAVNYNMDDLIIICETALSESLTFNNAVDLLILSNTLQLKKLKKEVKGHIATYSEVFAEMPVFKTMVAEHPPLAIELLQWLSRAIIDQL